VSVATTNKTTTVFRVRVISPEDGPRTAFVAAEKFSIGSLATLPLVIRDKSVDKKHLVISTVDCQIWITDQQTAGGTHVDGKAIEPNIPFHYCAGQKITLGSAKFVLEVYLFVLALDKDVEHTRILNEADERVKLAEVAKRKEIEASLAKAKADSDALRANARHQAEEIVQIAKEKADDLVKAEMKAQQKHVKMDFERERAEILKQAKEEAQALIAAARETAIEEAESSREQLLASSSQQAESIQEQARDAAEKILEA
jgi:pSer/pThr/pTyr-binding forkhead associated (FHA) protein